MEKHPTPNAKLQRRVQPNNFKEEDGAHEGEGKEGAGGREGGRKGGRERERGERGGERGGRAGGERGGERGGDEGLH